MAYEQQMRSFRIGSRPEAVSGTLLLSSNPDRGLGLSSKHHWVLCEGKRRSAAFEIAMPRATTLNHLEVALTFTQDKPAVRTGEKAEVVSVAKEQSKDSGSAPKEPAKALGLLLLRGKGNVENGEPAKKFHIPLMVYSHKGAQYDHTNSVTRMLVDNEIVFATNYPKPEIILCHQFGKRMRIEKVLSELTR